jgi:hypothetical protein
MLADFYICACLFLLVNCITDAPSSTSVLPRSPTAHSTKYPAEVASLLDITPGTEMVNRSHERYTDGDLRSVQTSDYPRRWDDDGANRLLAPRTFQRELSGIWNRSSVSSKFATRIGSPRIQPEMTSQHASAFLITRRCC